MARRGVILVLVSLLLGVVTNVGVAWVVAYTRPSDARWINVTPKLVYCISSANEFLLVCENSTATHSGVFFDRIVREDDQMIVREKLASSTYGNRDRVPSWARDEVEIETVAAYPSWYDTTRPDPLAGSVSYVVNGYGWPSIAMKGIRVEEIAWGLAHKSPSGPFQLYFLQGTRPVALPLGIVWPGFLINTLTYTAAWFVLLFAAHRTTRAFITRRRLRRGTCPTCCYDLRGDFSTGCPECGWNRAVTSRS